MVEDLTSLQYSIVDYDPFAGPELVAVAPATESQKEIWISCVLGGDDANRAFNESVSLKFTGALHKDKLEKALFDLIERHELLRSAFSADGKQICVHKNEYNQLQYEDVSHLTDEQQQTFLATHAQHEVLFVFDLLNGPLFNIKLINLSAGKQLLTLTAHHIICDGWSLSVMMQELGKIYSAYVQDIAVDLPPALSFVEYANEKSAFYESEEYKTIEDYWVNQYKENIPVVNVATDFPRPAVRTFSSSRLDYKVDASLTTAIKQLSTKSGSSFVTTLINAFEVFLHQLTGDETLIVGLPAADQAATGKYNLVGHCVNLLPLKSSIDGKTSFIDYLKLRKKDILDSFDHQQFTFGSLLKKLPVGRDASRVALVPIVFNVDMGMNDGVKFHGLDYEFVSNPRAFETFEIFLNISGSHNALTFEWSYNVQLFKPETINHMMEDFKNLLHLVVETPSIAIKDIQLISKQNLLSKLDLWNTTTVSYPRNKPVHLLIDETAYKFPCKTALIFDDKKISYKELNETANQFSHYLIDAGIKPGDIVAVVLDRSSEMLITLLAIMKAGAVYLPLDAIYPQDRIRFMLEDTDAKCIITNQKYKGKYSQQELFVEDIIANSTQLSTSGTQVKVNGNDLAYVLYTSGSTGKPKGVLIKHYNVVNMLCSLQKMPGISQHDVLLAVTTISFDIACVEMFLPLISGATVVLADAKVVRNGREILQILQQQQITIMQATPATYKMMLAAGWEQPLPIKILCGGEPMSKDLADKLLARCSALYNMYGPTETAVYSTGKQILASDEIITIGRPINNTQIYILNKNLNVVPIGTTGEIYIAGEGVGSGYLNLPELSAANFIKDAFGLAGGKMYKTGDIGKFLPNGEIQCLGRIDRQIKLRGFRIEPGEIEHAIVKNNYCSETIVTAIKDKRLQQTLVAYIVLKGTTDKSKFSIIAEDLKQQLLAVLPGYMVPDNFINLVKIPLLPNGKIDYKSLPKPQTETEQKDDNEYTESEKLVSDVWSEFLGVKNMGINDNFFFLGGHSLIAVEVMVCIEKKTGIKLPLSSLFEYPTIKKFATLLHPDNKETVWKSLVPIKSTGSKMPVYIIHGSGSNILNFSSFASYVDDDQPVYGLQAKGLDGSDEPLNNMEEIASYYISEVLKQNPDGPYAIAGYSFGGYVAVEMARQLRLIGKEIKMLAMFDTNAKDHFTDRSVLQKVWIKISRQFKKAAWISSRLIEKPKETIVYQWSYVTNKISIISRILGLSKQEKPDGYLLELHRISEQNDVAYYNYRIKPFDGIIDLFKSKDRVYFVDDFKNLGWKEYAKKGVRVHEVPGDHRTMLLSPNDRVFARTLQKALDNC